jgi:DNA-binding transcriptional regulator YiaG
MRSVHNLGCALDWLKSVADNSYCYEESKRKITKKDSTNRSGLTPAEILHLRYVEKMSVSAIAARYNVSRTAIHSTIQRELKKIEEETDEEE